MYEIEKKKEISQAVINRIPRYYRYISELKKQNVTRISSKNLANIIGLTASQVRQDFNCFGGFGQQGYGYNVEKLCEELEDILELRRNKTAIVVGVGNIGRALIKNFNFYNSGFRLVSCFDTNPDIIGRSINGMQIQDYKELRKFVATEKPDIAVLTLPKEAAVLVANMLVECGIRGIWNFTNVDLNFDQIAVENIHFSDSLMRLCYEVG
jgi:redox-sensing transcriptional repressor